MIIRMRHSEEKNKTDKSLFAQFPVSFISISFEDLQMYDLLVDSQK